MVSYFGGMFGEFICTQLSLDENFYSTIPKVDKNNRYYYGNPLEKYNLNLKRFDFSSNAQLSSETVNLIDSNTSEKHFCFPSHAFKVDMSFLNIPRIKYIRLNTQHHDILILGYLMSWIKSLLDLRDFKSHENEFVRYVNSQSEESIEYYNKIKNRGKFYWFEKVSMKHNVFNVDDFILYWWNSYMTYNHSNPADRWEQWNYIDVGECLKNYEVSKVEWKETFGLKEYLNKDNLENYYQTNLNLIDREFNIPFETLISGNWIGVLSEWVHSKI